MEGLFIYIVLIFLLNIIDYLYELVISREIMINKIIIVVINSKKNNKNNIIYN